MIYDVLTNLINNGLANYLDKNYSGLPDDFTFGIHNEFNYGIEHELEIVIKVLPADTNLEISQIPVELFFDTKEEYKENIIKAITDWALSLNETNNSGYKFVCKTPSVLNTFASGGVHKRVLISTSMTLLEVTNIFNLNEIWLHSTAEINNVTTNIKEKLSFIRYDLTFSGDSFSSGGMNNSTPSAVGRTKTIIKHSTNSYSIVAIVGSNKTLVSNTNVDSGLTKNYILKKIIKDKLTGLNPNESVTLQLIFNDGAYPTIIPCVVTVLGFSGTQRDIPIVNITLMRSSV